MSEDKRIMLVSKYLKRNNAMNPDYVLYINVLSLMEFSKMESGKNLVPKLVN